MRTYHYGIYSIVLFTSVTSLKLSPLCAFEQSCSFCIMLLTALKIGGAKTFVSQQETSESFSIYQQSPLSSHPRA